MQLWVILFIIFSITEIATTQLVSVWFAIGSLISLVSAAFGAPLWLQWIIFVISVIILLITTRPILKKIFKKNYIPTNGELDIGKTAIVIEDINNEKNTGRVQLKGVGWIARSVSGDIIPAGQTVVVVNKESNTMYVQLTSSTDEDTNNQ